MQSSTNFFEITIRYPIKSCVRNPLQQVGLISKHRWWGYTWDKMSCWDWYWIMELERGLVHAQALVRLVEEPQGLVLLGQVSVELQEEEQLGSELVMVVEEVVVEGLVAVVQVLPAVATGPQVGLAVHKQQVVLVVELERQGVHEGPEGLLVRLEEQGLVEVWEPLEEPLGEPVLGQLREQDLEDLKAVQLQEAG